MKKRTRQQIVSNAAPMAQSGGSAAASPVRARMQSYSASKAAAPMRKAYGEQQKDASWIRSRNRKIYGR